MRPKKELLVVRHGQTDSNKGFLAIGSTDINIPLNEKGIEQAHRNRERLKHKLIGAIYCSEYLRTQQHAEIINEEHGVEIIVRPELNEKNFGDMEGKKLSIADYWNLWDRKKTQSLPGNGESMDDFFKRVFPFFDELLENPTDKMNLIVAHGGIVRALRTYNGFIPNNSSIIHWKNGWAREIALHPRKKD